MKKILSIIALITAAHLYIGYYVSLDIEDPRYMVFIKKHPTLKLRFENIYTSDRDSRSLDELSEVELKTVQDYCKYRLGIVTRLESQAELEACKER
ncbi:hypothetical protein ASF84_22525 [Pseudomonas sp. Leaf127]|uniref:hypothetical protein n=1 Tax=Pseudomonas sp. Leaf127 TaxID=1736267 RepID=UPI000702D97F|nr:hypothetical protein [Pseudomonas sp. Leaf127]KQQ49974.1 hypothetical protein ASF84_22525 [Pseudomonas sp. Leaf127]